MAASNSTKIFGLDSGLIKLFLMPGGVTLVILMSVGLLFLPWIDKIKEKTKEIDANNLKISKIEEKIKYLKNTNPLILEKNAAHFNEAIFAEKNSYFLIDVVRLVGETTGFTIVDFSLSPGEVKSGDFDYGVATSGTKTTLVASDRNWKVDQWKNFQVRIVGGSGVGQVKLVKTNTATKLEFDAGDEIDKTTEYIIESAKKTAADVQKIPIKVSLIGPKDNLISFVSEIEKTLPILSLDQFSMVSESSMIKLNLLVSAYFIPDKSIPKIEALDLSDLSLSQEEDKLVSELGNFRKASSSAQKTPLATASAGYKKYDRENPFSF